MGKQAVMVQYPPDFARMARRSAQPCGDRACRAYLLTVSEFERLGGERWTQSFRIRLGLLANNLYAELYGKKPNKIRSSMKPEWRNRVSQYPCGILEQAYNELKSEDGRSRQLVQSFPEPSRKRES
jgi:hypothetical protein